MVPRLPSLRPGKFRLYEVKMALASPLAGPSLRFHCPMPMYARYEVSQVTKGGWNEPSISKTERLRRGASRTRTTCVCKNGATSRRKGREGVVAIQGSPNLLATGSDEEICLRLETSSFCLLDDFLGTCHVLVRAVCTTTNEASAKRPGPVLLFNNRLELG